jgi:hypothetical protein
LTASLTEQTKLSPAKHQLPVRCYRSGTRSIAFRQIQNPVPNLPLDGPFGFTLLTMVEQQAEPVAGQPAAAQTPSLLGVVERLLAGAAVAGAAIYVLINALYIEFYDDFGVRPEDVGLDRLAVLGRAAWVALVGIAVVGLIGYAYAANTARNRRRAFRLKQESALQDALDRIRADNSQDATKRSIDEYIEERISELQREEQALRTLVTTRFILGGASLIFAVLILFGFYLFERKIEEEAARVKRGENVNGISLVVPFIDVRATRANVTWIGDKERPSELGSSYLMYLGRGRDVAVFLACGRTTIVVPADAVAIDLLAPEPVDRQRLQFAQNCGLT